MSESATYSPPPLPSSLSSDPRGEKCMPWSGGGSSWNATRCSPIDDDPAGPGEPCTVEGDALSGLDDCELGALCIGVDDATNQGTCFAMCEGSRANPNCDGGDFCTLGGDSLFGLCLQTCHPLEQDCQGGSACHPLPDAFVCTPVAVNGGYGDPCVQVGGCDPGPFCATAEVVPGCAGTNCCTTYCDVSLMDASMACPGFALGQECVPWYEDGRQPPGLDNVGACAIPR